jgi:competence ComEA-like helix-hairpin-helix protein
MPAPADSHDGPFRRGEQMVLAVCCGLGLLLVSGYVAQQWWRSAGVIDLARGSTQQTAFSRGSLEESPPVIARPEPLAELTIPELPADSQPQPSGTPISLQVDINSADANELSLLPGIGPVLAGRIIAHRERFGAFHHVDDLAEVPGIGPKKLAALRSAAVVGR